MDSSRHVVLTGPMGVGKTTVGKLVAARLGLRFVDSDELVEVTEHTTARRVAAIHGVPYLHRVEARLVAAAIAADRPCVIAAAASVGDRPDLLGTILGAGHLLFLLSGDPAELAARSDADRHRRPLAVRDAVRLGAAREELVRGMGGFVVDTRGSSAAATADVIVAAVLAAGVPGGATR
jgi:shikimate kinase